MRLTFEKAFEKYKAHMIRSNYSVRTIWHKSKILSAFDRWLSGLHKDAYDDLSAVSCEIVLEYMDLLYLEGLQASSIKIYMTYLATFFKFLYNNDLVGEDPTRKLPRVKVPKKEVVFIPHDEIMKELDSMLLNPRTKGCSYETVLRDYWIVRVGYVTGWRSCESLACNPDEDVDWETGEIHIPLRKGGKDGYVFLDTDTCCRLKEWYYSRYPNGTRLWYSRLGKPLSYPAYLGVFKKYFSKGSHRLRASLATYLISQDVGIKDVADLLGHESVTSTMRYAAKVKTRIKGIHACKNPFSVNL